MTQNSQEMRPLSQRPPPLREYAAEAIERRLERLLSNADGVLSRDGTEPVHQMRVWSRRSRSALDTFDACFPGRAFARIRSEVKRITGSLGAARDLDVMIEGLEARAEKLPGGERVGPAAYVETLRQSRDRLQERVAGVVADFQTGAVLDRFRRLSQKRERRGGRTSPAPTVWSSDGEPPLLTDAALMIGARLNELIAWEPYLASPDCVHELHQMRIAAKRLRYTMELFSPAYQDFTPHGPQIAAHLADVEALQKHLGEIHDADVLVPGLLGFLQTYVASGTGKDAGGEPVVGVDRVDLDGAIGIVHLCAAIRKERTAHYTQLVKEWRRMREAGFPDSLRKLLRTAATESELDSVLGTEA